MDTACQGIGPNPLLRYENVTVRKEGRDILDSISLTLNEGENVAILGPNGSGKSSFIKTITREYYPYVQDRDVVWQIWGHEVWDILSLRSLLGIVSNDLQFTFTRDLTGFEVVISGFYSSVGLFRQEPGAEMRERAEEICEFLEIASLMDRPMTRMSSGEARRFLIGRALVHSPKALVLDEPTNSLDLHALHSFRRILRKIACSGTTIILVTHNIHDIIPEISRVILMKEGRFFLDGPKEEVLTDGHIGGLFSVSVRIRKENGYYYATGY